MYFFLDTGNLLKSKAAAPGSSRWSMAGAEDGRRSDMLAGSRQGTALPPMGRRSFSVAALLALLNCGAKFTAPPACSPRDTDRVGYRAWLCVPIHPPAPCALAGLLAAGYAGGVPGKRDVVGVTCSSSISCAEAVSRFAQRRGEPWCEQPRTALLPLETCCP